MRVSCHGLTLGLFCPRGSACCPKQGGGRRGRGRVSPHCFVQGFLSFWDSLPTCPVQLWTSRAEQGPGRGWSGPHNHLWAFQLFILRCETGQNSWQIPSSKATNVYKLCHRAYCVTLWDVSFIFFLLFALSLGFAKRNISFSPICRVFCALCFPFLILSSFHHMRQCL